MINKKSANIWNITKTTLTKYGLYQEGVKLFSDCKDDGNVVVTIQGVSEKYTPELRGVIQEIEEAYPCARLRVARRGEDV